jgi:hypothetical protein
VSQPPKKFPNYATSLSSIIDAKPPSFEENAKHVWWDAMEYNSIMKNYVWEIVSRPVGKSMIDSKWLHIAQGKACS